MGTQPADQPNSMDEPGGPEEPQGGSAGDAEGRDDKAAQGQPTDPDFEPPIVPGDTASARKP